MAGETKGLFYEAVVVLCCEEIAAKNRLLGKVFWNQRPQGMTIDTDVIIGRSIDEPSILFLISHSTSEHNSDMKFWRNMGELRQAKLELHPAPKVVCLLFDGAFKENLLILQQYAFDSFLEVSRGQYGQVILSYAENHAATLPKSRDEKKSYVASLAKENPDFRKAKNEFRKALETAIKSKNIVVNKLWGAAAMAFAGRPVPRIPIARNTFLRRGLAKSLLFDQIPKPSDKLLPVYETLGLARKSIAGTRLCDDEILSVLGLLPPTELDRLHQKYQAMPEFRILVGPLRAIDSFDAFWLQLKNNWDQVLTGKSLYRLLQSSHKSIWTWAGVGAKQGHYLPPGWVVVILLTLLKAASGKRMEYGYSKVVAAIEKMSPSERQIIVNRCGLSKTDLLQGAPRSPRTIEYGLRDWIFADARDNFDLWPSELSLVADVLSSEIRQCIGSSLPDILQEKVLDFIVQDTIETKLLSHPSFQPLKLLLIDKLVEVGLGYKDVTYWPAPFRGLALADGIKVNVRAGSTNVIQCRHTIIRWVSVSDAGKVHKCKEFGGRAFGFRVDVDAKSGKPSPSVAIRKTILLIDGTFDQLDLEALHQGGWDEIYYPDEIDVLAKAIV